MNEIYIDGITYIKHGGCWLDDNGNEVGEEFVSILEECLVSKVDEDLSEDE